MGWLQDQKNKIEEKKQAEEAERKKRVVKMQDLWERADLKAKEFVDSRFADLVGKTTKDGGVLKIDTAHGNYRLMAGEDCLVQVHVEVCETKEYVDDTGGYGWHQGTGEYYLGSVQIRLCQKYKDQYNIDREAWGPFRSCDDTELATYLMHFIEG